MNSYVDRTRLVSVFVDMSIALRCGCYLSTESWELQMAIFRASAELRDYACGGPKPVVSGPHIEILSALIEAMHGERGVVVPGLGRMAVVPVSGSKPRLIFHGARELNDLLADS